MNRPPQVLDPSELRLRSIPSAPARFRGLRSEYIRRHLEPLLPDAEEVEAFHRGLVSYLGQPDPTFLVRAAGSADRAEPVRTQDGTSLRPTDNAPAWWWHAVLFNGVPITVARFPRLIEGTPCHMFHVGPGSGINVAGWHVAHILNAKDGDTDWRRWDRPNATRRFVRNIHPCNVFYVPKTEWQRVGADPALIASVAGYYRERYQAVWAEFVRLAEGRRSLGLDAPDGGLYFAPLGTVVREDPSVPMSPTSGLRGQLPPPRSGPAPRPTGPGCANGTRYWTDILRPGQAPPVGMLLASHPEHVTRTRGLLECLTVQRLISIADALHNQCRPSDMRRLAQDEPIRQADLAWKALVVGIEKIHRPPTGWTATIDLLESSGSVEGLARVRVMDIRAVARVCANIVSGPYREACASMRG